MNEKSEKRPDGHYRVVTHFAVFGVTIRFGVVQKAVPISGLMRGMPANRLWEKWRRAKIERLHIED